MSKLLSRYALMFIAIMAIQLLVLNNINLGGFINPYIYILFIMLLPFDIKGWMLLVVGFITGLIMDGFTGTLGMHSSATLFVAFIRPYVLSNISTHATVDKKGSPAMSMNDLGWSIRYTILMVFAHHFVLFFLESFTFTHFFGTLLRIALSTVFTVVFILISQFLFIKE